MHFLASTIEVPVVVDGVKNPVPGLSLLLNYKPPINIQDHRGRTPLITAILNRHPAAAEALVSFKPFYDVNLKVIFKITAYYVFFR